MIIILIAVVYPLLFFAMTHWAWAYNILYVLIQTSGRTLTESDYFWVQQVGVSVRFKECVRKIYCWNVDQVVLIDRGFYDLSLSLRVWHGHIFPNFRLIIINFDIAVIFAPLEFRYSRWFPEIHRLPLTYLPVKQSELPDDNVHSSPVCWFIRMPLWK
jgi:hypothetical protein